MSTALAPSSVGHPTCLASATDPEPVGLDEKPAENRGPAVLTPSLVPARPSASVSAPARGCPSGAARPLLGAEGLVLWTRFTPAPRHCVHTAAPDALPVRKPDPADRRQGAANEEPPR